MAKGTAIEFGFLPERYAVDAGDIALIPVDNHAEIVERIKNGRQAHRGWIYPPLEEGPAAALRFELPITHRLEHRRSKSIRRLQFLIAAAGFVTGYRLLPKGHGHLQRAAIRRSHLTDIATDPTELGRALGIIDKTRQRYSAEQERLILASISAYYWGIGCTHQFEQLAHLYVSLDAICKFHFTGMSLEPAHWERARALAKHLKIPVPWWARKHRRIQNVRPKSSLSALRNQMTHEGLFAGEPFGYAVYPRQIDLDLQGLVSRAVVAALGLRCAYIHTPVDTRQMVGLDLAR